MGKIVLPNHGSQNQTGTITKGIMTLRELKDMGPVIEALGGQGHLTDSEMLVAEKTRKEQMRIAVERMEN